jgi:uncharacterized protein
LFRPPAALHPGAGDNPRMGRLILLLLVVVLLAWLLRRALAGRGRGAADSDAGATSGVPLVRCAHCGVNLPKTEARSAGGRHYCSEEHWRLGPRDG